MKNVKVKMQAMLDKYASLNRKAERIINKEREEAEVKPGASYQLPKFIQAEVDELLKEASGIAEVIRIFAECKSRIEWNGKNTVIWKPFNPEVITADGLASGAYRFH